MVIFLFLFFIYFILFFLIYQQQLLINQITKAVTAQTDLLGILQILVAKTNSLVEKNQIEFLMASRVVEADNLNTKVLLGALCFFLIGAVCLVKAKQPDFSSCQEALAKPFEVDPKILEHFDKLSEEVLIALENSNQDFDKITLDVIEKSAIIIEVAQKASEKM